MVVCHLAVENRSEFSLGFLIGLSSACMLSGCLLGMGLIHSFCWCPYIVGLNILSVLQLRVTCAPCKEATPYVPAASSPCPTGGQSVSRTPALPPNSVSNSVCV